MILELFLGEMPEISFQILKLTTERLRSYQYPSKRTRNFYKANGRRDKMITKIARKSNLLSLNASIEQQESEKPAERFRLWQLQ
jgi:hypothetical protein